MYYVCIMYVLCIIFTGEPRHSWMTCAQRLANVAVDAVFDSESIGTTFQKELEEVHGLGRHGETWGDRRWQKGIASTSLDDHRSRSQNKSDLSARNLGFRYYTLVFGCLGLLGLADCHMQQIISVLKLFAHVVFAGCSCLKGRRYFLLHQRGNQGPITACDKLGPCWSDMIVHSRNTQNWSRSTWDRLFQPRTTTLRLWTGQTFVTL